MARDNAVLEWVKGTALVPVKAALSAEEYETFIAIYQEALAKAYPPRTDGITLFPFRRLFMVAIRDDLILPRQNWHSTK